MWNFNVLAHDEVGSGQPSLTGYAEVRVMPRDINDNSPVFDRNRLVGKVAEHSNAGEWGDCWLWRLLVVETVCVWCVVY